MNSTEPGQEPQDPLELALRRALETEAAGIQPSPHGLRRIRAAIATREARRRRWWASPGPGWRPLLVTATAVVLVGGGIAAAPLIQFSQRDAASQAGATGAASTTTPAAGASPSGIGPPPALPTPSGAGPTSGPGPSPAPTAAPALPVYVVGERAGAFGLFREFRKTTAADPADRVQEAVSIALTGRPTSGAYRRIWAPDSAARTTLTDSVIIIDLNRAAGSTDLSGANGDVPGAIAVQQLVWTATAALASSAARQGDAPEQRPVRITVAGATVDLFGVDLSQPLARDYANDPRAGVWITSPQDGATLRPGRASFTGEGVRPAAGELTWMLTRGGRTAGSGSLTLTANQDGTGGPPEAGRRGFWTLGVDLPTAGEYRLEVSPEPGAAASGKLSADRVDFRVGAG